MRSPLRSWIVADMARPSCANGASFHVEDVRERCTSRQIAGTRYM
jgi:hypothetical protein